MNVSMAKCMPIHPVSLRYLTLQWRVNNAFIWNYLSQNLIFKSFKPSNSSSGDHELHIVHTFMAMHPEPLRYLVENQIADQQSTWVPIGTFGKPHSKVQYVEIYCTSWLLFLRCISTTWKKTVFIFCSWMSEGLRNMARDKEPSHIAGASNAEQRLNKSPAEVYTSWSDRAEGKIWCCCLPAPHHLQYYGCHPQGFSEALLVLRYLGLDHNDRVLRL